MEDIIFGNLIQNEKYSRSVLPHLKDDYFDVNHSLFLNIINTIFNEYNIIPNEKTAQQTLDDLVKSGNLKSEEIYASTQTLIKESYHYDSVEDLNWLIDKTEQFCNDQAVRNAVLGSVDIIQGDDQDTPVSAIPAMLQEAINVSFDNSVGHSYGDDAGARYDRYSDKSIQLPVDIDLLNEITDGGFPLKALVVAMGGPGTGKSLHLCHLAASLYKSGRNVLYISLEMSEEKIAERIDANLLNIDIKEVKHLGKDLFLKKVNKIKKSTSGRLVIKDYPTSTAHVGHFRSLLHDLKTKQDFVPIAIMVDYINICTSSRLKYGNDSYTYIKAIAEELRGLASEFNVCLFTATQTNRDGFGNSDVDLTNTSESFGLPATADMMYALIVNEVLDQQNQMMIKQLKNRYNDITDPRTKTFLIGINKSKMQLYNVEHQAQDDIGAHHAQKLTPDDSIPASSLVTTGFKF